MADDEKGSSIDLRMVFLAVALVGGASLIPMALHTERPAGHAILPQSSPGDQVVPARLWQDPFEVALGYAATNQELNHSFTGSTNLPAQGGAPDQFFTAHEIATQIRRHCDGRTNLPGTPAVVVLEVMISGGSYAEDSEQRLRSRYAVISALGVAGYAPSDPDHIGYAEVPWLRGESLERNAPATNRIRFALPLPYEWFLPNSLHEPQPSNDVLVVWLKSDAFSDHPARRLAYLNSRLRQEAAGEGTNLNPARAAPLIQFKLIDPSLGELIEEDRQGLGASSNSQEVALSGGPSGIEIFSSWSTTADALLTTNPLPEERRGAAIVNELAVRGWGTNFSNATCTDDELAGELIDELALRGVDVADPRSGVILISESDTYYGRALPLTFAAVRRFRTNDLFTPASFTNGVTNNTAAGVADRLWSCNQSDPVCRYIYHLLSRETLQAITANPHDDAKLASLLAGDFTRIIRRGREMAEAVGGATNLNQEELAALLGGASGGKWIHWNRRLVETEFAGMIATNRLSDCFLALENNAGEWPTNIICRTYLRGVDGVAPGDDLADKGAAGADTAPKGEPMPRPEGRSQLDYLPRLADRLETMEAEQQAQGFDIRAIGILGSDVYDKLLVLQSLRRKFTDELFFTTDLDARLLHPDSLKWTRNVIVASSFGLQLRDEFQQQTPPFRDTYQTGEYLACLAALDFPGARENLSKITPRRFEIGRNGGYDLSMSENPVDPPTSRPAIGLPARLEFFLLVAAVAGLTIFWLGSWPSEENLCRISNFTGDIWSGNIYGGTDKAQGLELWLYRSALLAPPLCATAFVWQLVLSVNCSDGDPFSLTDGISLWPCECLRVLAAWLAFFFLFWAQRSQEKNKAALAKEFKLSRNPDRTLGDHPESKEEIYAKYDQEGFLWKRFRRIWKIVACYLLMSSALFLMFDAPFVPFRGGRSKWVDHVVLLTSSLMLIALLFFFIDTATQCRVFIRRLQAARNPAWPDPVCEEFEKKTQMPRQQLFEYIDVKLVAARTEEIGGLIFYPFIVLFLMIVARASFFDRWDWPPSIILIFGLNSVYAAYAVWALRLDAEKLRRSALQKIQERTLPLLAGGNEGLLEQLRALGDEIKHCDQGALAPVLQQPFVKAILVPLTAIVGTIINLVLSRF